MQEVARPSVGRHKEAESSSSQIVPGCGFTMHHALGFRPPVPGSTAAEVVHQFLNTGLAVHAAVIRRFLDAEGITYASEK